MGTTTVGVVIGGAWKGDSQPYPQARIRLRSVNTGRGVARTLSDVDGRFRSSASNPAPMSSSSCPPDDKVHAIGDLFGVTAGGQVTTLVRLSSKTPWFARLLRQRRCCGNLRRIDARRDRSGIEREPASGQ